MEKKFILIFIFLPFLSLPVLIFLSSPDKTLANFFLIIRGLTKGLMGFVWVLIVFGFISYIIRILFFMLFGKTYEY